MQGGEANEPWIFQEISQMPLMGGKFVSFTENILKKLEKLLGNAYIRLA